MLPSPGTIESVRSQLAAGVQPMFIGGAFAFAAESFVSENPATGAVIAQVAAAGAGEVDRAVTSAAQAFGAWAAALPQQRANCLLKLAGLVEAAAEEIALVE